MKDLSLLSRIYQFPHKELNVTQDPDVCKQLASLLISFSEHMDDEEYILIEPQTGYDKENFEAAATFLSNEEQIRWLPSYGCAILCYNDTRMFTDSFAIQVLGIDNHSFLAHTGRKSYDFNSKASGYVLLPVGTVSGTAGVSRLLNKFEELQRRAQERKDNKRSAANGHQGHQRTPVMIEALLRQALFCKCNGSCGCIEVTPRGGFTDVGLHTGGKVRDTCFTLVRSAYQWSLDQQTTARNLQYRQSFLAVIVHFHKWILNTFQDPLKPIVKAGDNITKRGGELNATFYILQRAACDASILSDYGYDMDLYYKALCHIQKEIDRAIKVWDKLEATRYNLVDSSDASIELSAQSCPKVTVPLSTTPSYASQTSPDKLRKLVNNHLGCLSRIPRCTRDLPLSAATWAKCMKDQCKDSSTSTIYFLRGIENLVWALSDSYLHVESIEICEIECIMDIIDTYRLVLHNFITSNHECLVELKVNLQSIELLLVWVSYCLVFNSISKTHSNVMANFGVALKITDLQHLVLQDKRHRDVMERVVLFLHENSTEDCDIFSLRTHTSWNSATFKMGCKYAERHLNTIWEAEEVDANKRIDQHWAEIQRKQQLARDLRAQLPKLQGDLTVASCKLSDASREYRNIRGTYRSTYSVEYHAYNACTREVNRINSLINSKQNEIESAEKAPAPVFQPLPVDRNKGMKVLFFLHMPKEYRALSRLTFTAQQLLVPYPWVSNCGGEDGISRCNIFELVKATQWNQQWSTHYNGHQGLYMCSNPIPRSGKQGDVGLMMETNANIPSSIGPNHVDHFTSRSQGVWYPDERGIHMSWTGGCHTWDRYSATQFNPFTIEPIITAPYFAFKLPTSCNNLQWCLHQQVVPKNIQPSRGNRPYASQDMRPEWLSKEGYLDYANLRAFPNLELRKLCDVLMKRSLPLDHVSVRLLIRQVLYHVGEIGIFNNKAQLKWRQDFKDVMEACYHLLVRLAAELKERPCNFEACQLVGKISCYFSSYSHHNFKEIGRDLAFAAIEWTQSYEDAIAEESPAGIFSLRSKQVMYSYTSVLCVVVGDIRETDADIIIKNIVMACNLFVEDDRDSGKRIELKAICEYLLSFQMLSYLDILNKDPSMITNAVRKIIESCPPILKWHELDTSICFEASGSDGHLYSVNPLTGIVLVDGLPPHHLPTSISESKLYKRVFGDRKFEVITKGGAYETVRRVEGCFYRFFQVNDNIVIQESSYNSNNTDCWEDMLELLDFARIDQWGNNLPPRLCIMYSHWVSRKRSVLLMRPHSFKDRIPTYIHSYTKNHCRKLPLYEYNGDWLHLISNLSSMDRLINHQSPYLSVLERLEHRDMMHTYMHSDNSYSQVLYRFGLTLDFKSGGGSFLCQEIAGYKLADTQHLKGTLNGLNNYLILNAIDNDNFLKVHTKILVPLGNISTDDSGCTKIEAPDAVDEQRKFYIYDMHPRFEHLVAHSICARLHLAGIHIATSCCIPDSLLNRSGEERAIELIRECWVNRPLSEEESGRLCNVKCLCVGSCPAVFLLCLELERSASQFSFLHQCDTSNLAQVASDEAVAYCECRSRHEASPRMKLSNMEEYRTIGMATQVEPDTHIHTIASLIECEAHPCTDDDFRELYTLLDASWEEMPQCQSSTSLDSFSDKFPFPKSNTSPLEDEIFNELSKSWKLYCDTKVHSSVLSESFCNDKETYLSKIELKVSTLLESTEQYLFSVLSCKSLTQQNHLHRHGIQLKRLVNVVPTLTRRDIASLACFPERIIVFNPLLSRRSQSRVKESIIKWLELCVLEDKIQALQSHLSCGNDNAILQELQNIRKWNVVEHPYWLVFEVEQKIRIRPEQFKVAQHLIDHPGDIVQLNMGLGKTRVILPMLVLHYSFAKELHSIPRLHILSPLFNEACAYFHDTLCASVLNRKIFCLPFNRSVDLNFDQAQTIQDMVKYCQHEKGFFIVTPESRLSLELKSKELYMSRQITGSSELSEALNLIITASWQDVFDEVDEILHHRYQLIYAFGDVCMLPQGKHRWEAFQSLVQVVLSIDIPGVTIIQSGLKDEAYSRVVVDKCCDKTDFRKVVVNKLVNDPPRRHQWIKALQHAPNSDDIIGDITKVLSDPRADPKSLQLTEEHLYDILALRGFLAYDILIHCLLKRHRVDYGVKAAGKKRLAVPFRGADTPSERSEFSHPDCAIALSILAYYDNGLLDIQIKQALSSLLKLGDNARRAIYNEWFSLSQSQMSEGDTDAINAIDKIDLSNKVQLKIICKYFKKNMRTIDFWLSTCVLPYELDQYPQRLVANSWNLAHNKDGHVTGFSGTNDNHHILPLQVKQYLPWDTSEDIWKRLLATNGQMLDTIILKTMKVEEIPKKNSNNEALVAYITNMFKRNDPVHALIDSGALLAGWTNLEVANHLLKVLPDDLLGVVFFDNVTHNGEWMILELSGRCLPKNQSPVNERNAFALFDEPRCRGSDLKLKPEAVAVQTLGRGMRKDKFMQGAGRMRNLQMGQQLVIVANSEVYSELYLLASTIDSITMPHTANVSNMWNMLSGAIGKLMPSAITTKHVLSWVMQNTIESTWKGLSSWSDQGLFFATNSTPEHALLDEKNDLDSFFGSAIGTIPLDSLASSLKEFHYDRIAASNRQNISDNANTMCQYIVKRCKDLGQSYCIMRTGADEECERELELEIEEESEKEIEEPRMKPVGETHWDYASIFQASSDTTISSFVAVPLGDVISAHLSVKSLGKMSWSKSVYCTRNFIDTVLNVTHQKQVILDRFLKVADIMIRLPNGKYILVSEREADHLLVEFWKRRECGHIPPGLFLCHRAFECGEDLDVPPLLRIGSKITEGIKDDVASSLQLFAGETNFRSEGRKKALKDILSSAKDSSPTESGNISKASGNPDELVIMRGKFASFDMSDLEQMCMQLACEVEANAT